MTFLRRLYRTLRPRPGRFRLRAIDRLVVLGMDRDAAYWATAAFNYRAAYGSGESLGTYVSRVRG